jgi:hypothetical protein
MFRRYLLSPSSGGGSVKFPPKVCIYLPNYIASHQISSELPLIHKFILVIQMSQIIMIQIVIEPQSVKYFNLANGAFEEGVLKEYLYLRGTGRQGP